MEYIRGIDRHRLSIKSLDQQAEANAFGTFKRRWGFTHTLMRGKAKVLGEVSTLFTAYNLRRTMSVLGFSSLLGRLKALIVQIFNYFVLRSIITHHMIL